MRGTTMATVVASLVLASPASAEVRSGSVSDPRDLTGAFAPDLERVTVGYDPATGGVRLGLRFYEAQVCPPVGLCTSGPQGTFRGRLGRVVDGSCRTEDTTIRAFIAGDLDEADVTEGDLIVGSLGNDGNVSALEYGFVLAENAVLKARDYGCVGDITIENGEQTDAVAGFFFAGFEPRPQPGPAAPPASTAVQPGSAVGPPAQTQTGLGAQSVLGSATAGGRRLSGSAKFGRRGIRLRIVCPSTGRARVLIRGRRLTVRRTVRCVRGRVLVKRVSLPRRLRAVRLVVAIGEARVSVRMRR